MDMIHISIGSAGIIVVLGMAIVFLGLILLMLVMQIMSKIVMKKMEKAAAAAKSSKSEQQLQPIAEAEPAPGTAGDLKLYNTDPRDAAMIMAIVANSMGKPLNELRFKSIREIKEDEKSV